jgi:hypothetical protein
MCGKCEEIAKVILRYRTLSTRVTDRLTLEGLQQLIEKLEAEKKSTAPRSTREVGRHLIGGPFLAAAKCGLISAPRLPQALQTNRGSISDSLTSSSH